MNKDVFVVTISGVEAEKEAQDLIMDSGRHMNEVEVRFSLVFDKEDKLHIVPCTWLDPYLGFFQVDGVDGFVRFSDVPKEYRVMGQRIEQKGTK